MQNLPYQNHPDMNIIFLDLAMIQKLLSQIDYQELIHNPTHSNTDYDEIGKYIYKSLYELRTYFNQILHLTQSQGIQVNIQDIRKTPIHSFLKLPYENKSLEEIQAPNLNYNDKNQRKRRGPYRSYSVSQKKYIVQLYEQGMKFSTISKVLKVPQKNVVRWCHSGLFKSNNSTQITSKRLRISNKQKKILSGLSYAGIKKEQVVIFEQNEEMKQEDRQENRKTIDKTVKIEDY